jgi:hypothetical protein
MSGRNNCFVSLSIEKTIYLLNKLFFFSEFLQVNWEKNQV